MENKEEQTAQEIIDTCHNPYSDAHLDEIINEFYYVPSKFNIIGRISFYLNKSPTKKQLKKQLKNFLKNE